MRYHVGTGILTAGIVALIAGIDLPEGNVMRASFWGWRVAFQTGILAIFLGVCAIRFEPDTTTEVMVTTGIGVIEQLSVSLAILAAGRGI